MHRFFIIIKLIKKRWKHNEGKLIFTFQSNSASYLSLVCDYKHEFCLQNSQPHNFPKIKNICCKPVVDLWKVTFFLNLRF